MNNTRTGKIARLPKSIRDELDRRLENGGLGTELVAWLNAQPEVQVVLQKHFAGRPVNDQNLTNWKSGGFQEKVRQTETLQLTSRLLEESDTVSETIGNQPASDRFATLLAVEMVRFSQSLMKTEPNSKGRWASLCQINSEFSRLRRDDHRAILMDLKNRQLNHRTTACDREEKRQAAEQQRRELLAAFSDQLSQFNTIQGDSSPT